MDLPIRDLDEALAEAVTSDGGEQTAKAPEAAE
jgi:hypothetical protein